MTRWALIPVKEFGRAKSRLSPRFDSKQRARLASAMVQDCLASVAAAKLIDRIALISSEPSLAQLAAPYGAEVIEDTYAGLNEALENGRRILRHRGAETILVLPADLPCIRSEDVDVICQHGAATTSCVAVPAHDGGGTNALLTWSDDDLPYGFGSASFSRHLNSAASRGLSIQPLLLPRVSADLDTPEDLARIIDNRPGQQTSQVLAQLFQAPGEQGIEEVS